MTKLQQHNLPRHQLGETGEEDLAVEEEEEENLVAVVEEEWVGSRSLAWHNVYVYLMCMCISIYQSHVHVYLCMAYMSHDAWNEAGMMHVCNSKYR